MKKKSGNKAAGTAAEITKKNSGTPMPKKKVVPTKKKM